jgi:endosialidase-like protein
MSSIFSKPDPPTPPNPVETARASTSTNVATGVANAYLNNVNQSTPRGSLNYNQTGSYQWDDPVTGTSYNIPTFTATQTLSPTQQAIQGQQEAAQYNLAGLANSQSGRVSGLLSSNLTNADAPSGGSAQNIANVPWAATSYNTGGPIQSQLGPSGDITNTYGPADNYSADRQRVEDALMQRMNPQLQVEQQRVQQQLADQGIRYGSQAYSDAMRNYSQQANDARWGAIQQGGAEQQRMNQMSAQLAAFQNAAQQQGFEQQQGRGAFANQAQQQQYTQNAALAAFGNTGLAQQLAQQQSAFNASQAGRNQWLQEQFALRNQPINEISALMAGSQVSMPNFLNTQGSQIPTTDIAGLMNQNFNQQMGLYTQQSNQANQLMGGLLGLGAGALKLSDKREKEDIKRIGTIFSPGVADVDHDEPKKELPIYQYSYKQDPASTTHVGPMAQDVEKMDPDAVKTIKGTKYIDQRRMMGSLLRAS